MRREETSTSRTSNARRPMASRSEHFDVFSMTQHVECVGVLVRASSGPMVSHGWHGETRGDTRGLEMITHL
jgi:hypothetical protein